MGQEARCIARYGGSVAEVKALLESEEILLRGEIRLRLPFESIRRIEAADGELRVETADGPLVLELGDRAERWAERVRNPRTLVDKLGVKDGAVVSLVGVDDGSFLDLLRARTDRIADGPAPGSDIVLFQIESREDLARIASLESAIVRDGAIWVVSPRGRPDLRETDVLEAGREAGLVDTKVARFSNTHTAHRFQIPKARR